MDVMSGCPHRAAPTRGPTRWPPDRPRNSATPQATLTAPCVFNDFELTCNSKLRYRVYGVDILTGHTQVSPSARTLTKDGALAERGAGDA